MKQVWDFRVVGDLHADLILGMSWLQSVNPCVDFVAKTCTLPSGECVLGQCHDTQPAVQLCALSSLLHTVRADK